MSAEPEESDRTQRLKSALESEQHMRKVYGYTVIGKIEPETVDAILEAQIEMSKLLDQLTGSGG